MGTSEIEDENLETLIEASQEVLKPSSDKEEFIKHLTMGIEDTLKAHPMIKDIKLVTRPPASSFLMTAWERRYGVRLPADLRGYYGSSNGFHLTWNLVYADEILKVGNLCINSIQALVPVETTLTTTDSEMDQSSYTAVPATSKISIPLTEIHRLEKGNPTKLSVEFGHGITAFHLDSSKPNTGSVFLLYKKEVRPENYDVSKEAENKMPCLPPLSSGTFQGDPNAEIWLLDRSFHWHFLASSFSTYYRMALFHLGLPEWMYRFTSLGLSSWTEQIFWLIAPKLLQPLKPNSIRNYTIWSTNVPPEGQLPNPNPNVLNLSMLKKKKKVNLKCSNKQ